MYYRVIPFENSFDSIGLIYRIPESYHSNNLVGVVGEFPFWKKVFRAVLAKQIDESIIPDLDYEVKDMLWLISESPILTSKEIEMIEFIAKHYFCLIHQALKLYISTQLLQNVTSLKYFSWTNWDYSYLSPQIQLSHNQQNILQSLKKLPSWSTSLLYWVTGSGKTQIYIKLIQEVITSWWQALLLIPEIILTSQIGEKLQKYFWKDIIFIHSHISPLKKIQYYRDIASGDAQIIIWTRSALFYPYHSLKYIIIDEEHDKSYISDTSPRYHTKTLALKMSEIYRSSLLLWSWTPNLDSLYRWLQGEYHFFQLLESYKK